MRASSCTPSGRWKTRPNLTIPLIVLLCSPSWGFDGKHSSCARVRKQSCRAGGGSPRDLFSTTVFSSEFHLRDRSRLLMVGDGSDGDNPGGANDTEKPDAILSRFTSPVIDDPGLPLTDVLVAQVIAPSLQIAWLSLQHAPQPTWLKPIFDTSLMYTRQGSFVAPALIHGAALASCWIVGALAAKAYERKSISPVKRTPSEESSPVAGFRPALSNVEWDYGSVVTAIFQSGAFATGLLILATQADLFLEYGRWVQVGESEDIDFRLLVAIVELINDVFFEAATITAWRLYLAFQTERMARE